MEKETRKKHAAFVQNNITTISRSTKRKSAYLKINISDELAEDLIKSQVKYCPDNFPKVMGLSLVWEENLTDEADK